MIYAISYDLNTPGQNYDGLHSAIKNCGPWWHYLKSTWLVDTNLRADQVWNRLSSHCDKNDLILIVGITQDYSGWLPKDAWDWINQRLRRAA